MAYWLVKQEPTAYSWDDLVKDGATDWTGVRNFKARNHLKEMKKGDKVFFRRRDQTVKAAEKGGRTRSDQSE